MWMGGSTANPDIIPKAGIHAPSTKWTLVIHPAATQFAHSAILTDMINLYHTNAYLKSIIFSPNVREAACEVTYFHFESNPVSCVRQCPKPFSICLLSGPWKSYMEEFVNQANNVVHSFFGYHA